MLRKEFQGFQKLFFFDISLYLLNFVAIPNENKNIKNCISILAIVNYRHWLGASPL